MDDEPTEDMGVAIKVTRVERVISLRPCDRCGEMHLKVLFKPFSRRDIGSWTHWSICPTNGEPVLMRFRATEAVHV